MESMLVFDSVEHLVLYGSVELSFCTCETNTTQNGDCNFNKNLKNRIKLNIAKRNKKNYFDKREHFQIRTLFPDF